MGDYLGRGAERAAEYLARPGDLRYGLRPLWWRSLRLAAWRRLRFMGREDTAALIDRVPDHGHDYGAVHVDDLRRISEQAH